MDSRKLGIESQVQEVTFPFAISVGLPLWPLKACLQNQTLAKLASNEGLRPIGEILYEAKNLTELEIQSGFRFRFPEDISSYVLPLISADLTQRRGACHRKASRAILRSNA